MSNPRYMTSLFEFDNLTLQLADDLVADRHVVGKWRGVLAHSVGSRVIARSKQGQIRAGKGRKLKSAVGSVAEFSLTQGVNGHLQRSDRHNASRSGISPPWRVAIASSTDQFVFSDTKFTLPSARRKLQPPGCQLENDGAGRVLIQ